MFPAAKVISANSRRHPHQCHRLKHVIVPLRRFGRHGMPSRFAIPKLFNLGPDDFQSSRWNPFLSAFHHLGDELDENARWSARAKSHYFDFY